MSKNVILRRYCLEISLLSRLGYKIKIIGKMPHFSFIFCQIHLKLLRTSVLSFKLKAMKVFLSSNLLFLLILSCCLSLGFSYSSYSSTASPTDKSKNGWNFGGSEFLFFLFFLSHHAKRLIICFQLVYLLS